MHKPLIYEQRQEIFYFTEVRYDTIDKQMIDIPEKNDTLNNCNDEDKDLQTMKTIASFKTIMDENPGECFLCKFSGTQKAIISHLLLNHQLLDVYKNETGQGDLEQLDYYNVRTRNAVTKILYI